MITMDQIKELRDKTGISIMQCRKALEEANGDMDKALDILKAKGADASAKKNDRTLGAGVIASYIHGAGAIGAMVELASETDFVSKNEEFKELARSIAMQVAAANPKYLSPSDVPADAPESAHDEVLLNQPFIKNPEQKVSDLINSAIQKFGEKIAIVRYTRYGLLEG